jgi:small subunit ribosomal protein S19
MSRSSFKGPFFNPNIFKKLKIIKLKTNNVLKTFSKNTTILPGYIDKTLSVYNGKKWVLRAVSQDMVGYVLGSFIFTRKIYKYKKK